LQYKKRVKEVGKTKKEIKILKKDSSNGNYTFVGENNILNNLQNESNNEKKLENKSDARIEKKIHSKKVDNKGRKILGKSLQGHSPIYE
jgi:hypothetical protein